MKLDVAIDGAAGELIEILSPAPECLFRVGEGPVRDAGVAAPEPGVYSIVMDGRDYDARVEESPAGLIVTVHGYRFEVQVRDPRRWSRKSGARGGEGIQTVLAPMPGNIVRVLVAPGDEVQAGQGLVVVEAMKMQNEMKAARAGHVIAVAAKEGSKVTAGEPLVTIGP